MKNLTDEEYYIQGFNAVPLLLNHGGESATKYTWDAVGYGYECILNQYENDYCHMYYHTESLKNIYREIMTRYERDNEYVKNLINQSEGEFSLARALREKVEQLELDELPDSSIIQLLKDASESYARLLGTAHVIEGFSLNSDTEIKRRLLERLTAIGRQDEFSTIFTALTTASQPSFVSQQEASLLHIADRIRENPELLDRFESMHEDLREKIERHQEAYFWIAASYAAAPIADIEYFLNEIRQALEERKREPRTDAIDPERREVLMDELHLGERLRSLIRISDNVSAWQDERKKYMLSCACYVDLLAGKIAERVGIEHNLVRYLIPEELDRIGEFTTEELQKRREGCIVVYTRDTRDVLTGNEYKTFMEELHEHESDEMTKEIPGMCASTGYAVGNVHICKSYGDIKKFREGDILVTIMTRPEFVPAMKKAAAIITDEGGVTSHAAIISRELGKPCVIGTRNATKLLKDGDLVEVKASHGAIHIIERVKE